MIFFLFVLVMTYANTVGRKKQFPLISVRGKKKKNNQNVIQKNIFPVPVLYREQA